MTLKLENQFITSVVDGKLTFEDIMRSNFEPNYLKYNADIYEWLMNYWQLNKKLPSKDLVSVRYPTYDAQETIDVPIEILDALKKGSELDRLNDDISKTVTLIQKTGRVDTAVDYLSGRFQSYDTNLEQDVFDLLDPRDSDKLLDFYKERHRMMETEGYVGIPTGFGTEMDLWLNGGSQKGNLYGILAPLGTGKTWGAMVIGGAALDHQKSPFMLFLEGNLEKEGYRSLSVGTGVSNSALHTAQLDVADVQRAIEFFQRKAKANGDLHYYLALHGNRATYTPTILRSKLIKYKPEIAIIDYLSLMGIANGGKMVDEWQVVSFISKELKKMAVSLNIPIWVVLQGNRGSQDKDELTAADSSFYNAIRDFDGVIGITKVPNTKYTLRVNGVKGRDSADDFKAYYTTNWDQGRLAFKGYMLDEGEGGNNGREVF